MDNNIPRLKIVVTTCGNQEDAKKLARHLVEKKIAACAQVLGPITSFYWWEGKLEEDTEWQVKFKILADKYEHAEAAIKDQHPYELPQIVCLEIEKSLPEYALWVAKETQ